MSKKGRKCRRWHYERIREEFDCEPEVVIQEFFEMDTAISVMAGVLGLSYGEMHEWIQELGLEREAIPRANRHPVKERLGQETGCRAVRLICSERACGLTYREIRDKYGVSTGFIASCLHQGAPWLVGTPGEPIAVGPQQVGEEERARRSARCREHNLKMKEEKEGWFANHSVFFRPRRSVE